MSTKEHKKYVCSLDSVRLSDIHIVGGKNASLGELIGSLGKAGVAVPGGFATTAHAYREFLQRKGLGDRIQRLLISSNPDDVKALARTGAEIRDMIMETPFPSGLLESISDAYEVLVSEYGDSVSWAVRSSATAEDLPDASFAGQQETYLNITGLDHVIQAIHRVFASLYNDRAISYRVHKGFSHEDVMLSAGVQKMVRSDLACSGVMFTLDTESGFDQAVFITSSYGLGETVVQGAVNPDEFYAYKRGLIEGKPALLKKSLGEKALMMVYDSEGPEPVKMIPVNEPMRRQFSLDDAEVEELGRIALAIESHYQCPVDIEWAKDGLDERLYVVQARPETVQSQRGENIIERYSLQKKGRVVVQGRAIGNRIGQGRARVIKDVDQIDSVAEGDVLVTDMTDPDWEPIMKKAAAIVTNRGGRTCHAAIIARELGVPAVVGSNDATEKIKDGMEVTVTCAEGDSGFVYEGLLPFDHQVTQLDEMPPLPLKVMMNVGNPHRAFDFAMLPNHGVGLARLEFIINNMVGIHPQAILEPALLSEPERLEISKRTAAYNSPKDFYIQRIREGVATIAAAFWPEKVIVRLSDFKSNEYANLIGGTHYEPVEENPMLGFRGAARYLSTNFRPCFDLECEAIRLVRDGMGLNNISVMVPFVRTVDQARRVCDVLTENGLERGRNGLEHIMMCELPTNIILADKNLEYFDGFSIGSNDLTQLTLGLDRDSSLIAEYFDERDEAVQWMLSRVIETCRKAGKYIGICGQGPSDHPDLARWLLQQGISSISLNPDTVVSTWLDLSRYATDGVYQASTKRTVSQLTH